MMVLYWKWGPFGRFIEIEDGPFVGRGNDATEAMVQRESN